MFERWAETVCGLAPPRASRPTLGAFPIRLSDTAPSESTRADGGTSVQIRSLIDFPRRTAAQEALSAVMRESAAAAASCRLRGKGGAPSAPAARHGNGVSGAAAARAPARVDRGKGSMLYRERYQDSWERITAERALSSKALHNDLRDMTQALSRHQQRSESAAPPSVHFAAPEGAKGGEGGWVEMEVGQRHPYFQHAAEVLLRTPASSNKGIMLGQYSPPHSVHSHRSRAPLLYDPDLGGESGGAGEWVEDVRDAHSTLLSSSRQYARWQEQLC